MAVVLDLRVAYDQILILCGHEGAFLPIEAYCEQQKLNTMHGSYIQRQHTGEFCARSSNTEVYIPTDFAEDWVLYGKVIIHETIQHSMLRRTFCCMVSICSVLR